tara:strand:+ start:141 stop:554 length:414 start_codon:yes stop_codon:yes gene_type:complete
MAGKSFRAEGNMVKQAQDVRTNEEQLLNAPYGQQGAVVFVEEGRQVKGDFYCLIALHDDVILSSDLTQANWDVLLDGGLNPGEAAASWSGASSHIPLPVGLPFYGNFKAVGLINQGPTGANIAGHCADCPKLIAYYK